MSDTCTVFVENTGESYECGFDELVLDAGLNAGLHLPHNCRGGACGECKVQVVSGEVDPGWAMNFGIDDAERAEGKCLICQSKPLTPELRIRSLGEMTAVAAGEVLVRPVDVRARVVATVIAGLGHGLLVPWRGWRDRHIVVQTLVRAVLTGLRFRRGIARIGLR